MSALTTDNVPYQTEDTQPVDFAPDSDSDSDGIEDSPQVDFTIDNVPEEVENIRMVGLLYVEILRAGDMMATGSEVLDRANAQKIKNHVAYWAYIHPADATYERTTIRFSMNVVNPDASFGSNDARYVPSDRPSFGSTSSGSGKPTSPGNVAPGDDVPPDNAVLSVASGDGSSVPGGNGSSGDAASLARLFPVLPEGAPALGTFDIKVRDYSGRSNSAVTFFTLRIIGEPTLGQFLDSLRGRHMLPFYFPKVGFSYNGCRHFASEAVEAWKKDEFVMDICMRTKSPFRNLIAYRYTPLEGLPADPLASSEEGGSQEGGSQEEGGEEDGSEDEGGEVVVTSGMRKTPNPIDRGIFPEEFQSLTAGYPFAN